MGAGAVILMKSQTGQHCRDPIAGLALGRHRQCQDRNVMFQKDDLQGLGRLRRCDDRRADAKSCQSGIYWLDHIRPWLQETDVRRRRSSSQGHEQERLTLCRRLPVGPDPIPTGRVRTRPAALEAGALKDVGPTIRAAWMDGVRRRFVSRCGTCVSAVLQRGDEAGVQQSHLPSAAAAEGIGPAQLCRKSQALPSHLKKILHVRAPNHPRHANSRSNCSRTIQVVPSRL